MAFYEIDFIEAGENKSGDAIALRYGNGLGTEMVHVVDGGYATTDDGQRLIDLIKIHYDQKDFIDHVVLTHPDTDHASGLKTVVEKCNIGTLWMNRPWLYVNDLLPLFEYKYTRDGLIQRLKQDFPHTAEIEEIATQRGIQILEAFQGATIGSFVVLAPSRQRYLNLVVQSEKTPEANGLIALPKQIIKAIKGLWGEENLKGNTEGTSRENEMSVVQYAYLAEHKILLTGDAGIEGLEEAYQYAKAGGLSLPGLNFFQAPHHGGRRNLSSEILDKWLGPKLPYKPTVALFSVGISANKNDEDHPRKAVRRAIAHRGGGVLTTKGNNHVYWFNGKPLRANWFYATHEDYPEDSEE
jgi:beta-lactamase superfamily II metal-dependent hydrolase